jgi:HlyD family secretion protein
MANSKKRRKIIVFGAILFVLAGLGAWVAFGKRDVFISVQTDKVTRRDLTEIVVANGRIQPVTQVKISPEVSGEIIELPVKEGQPVKKGDLIVRIKPDFYEASRNSAKASYSVALAGLTTQQAMLDKAEAELKRNAELFDRKLISESIYLEFKTTRDVAAAQFIQSKHQIEMAKAALDKAEEDLRKTTIYSPLDGTVTRLISQVGERVVGTAMMAGTDIMVVSDLTAMEARVDIGEIDVVLIKPGQIARLEVDAFKDRKFKGVVTEIANSAKGTMISGGGMGGGGGGMGGGQDSTKFEVRIRVKDEENFRPGMSVTTEIETRYRTNAITVPIGSVTARMPKPEMGGTNSPSTNVVSKTDSTNQSVVTAEAKTNSPGSSAKSDKKADKKANKTREVVFVVDGDKVKQVFVKIGISDENYWEITEGLNEGQEIVTGGFKAVTRDLEDGKKIRKGGAVADADKDKKG